MSRNNSQSFRDFEWEGWQKVAGLYHDSFAGVTVQCIANLLDAANVLKGKRVLDLACGPGYAAAAAASRGADVLGIDFSPQMVAEARTRHRDVSFQEGDAESLALDAASFDAVIMNFGMLHLEHPDRAMREVFRILRPGGLFAFTVWDIPQRTAGFGVVLSAIQKHGDINVSIPAGPPFFRFSDLEEAARELTPVGFTDIRSIVVPQTWRLATADRLFEIMMNASVRNAALLHAQRPEVLAAILNEIRSGLETFRTAAGFELPMPAILTSARRVA